MQSFVSERDAVQAPRATANRPSTELPPSLLGPSACTVLRGSVIAEPDQDLARLFTRYPPGYHPRQNGLPATRVPEPCPTAPHRPPDATMCGNMMELEHVPKARLLVRHPVQHTASSMTFSGEMCPLLKAPSMATSAFGRSIGVSSYSLSMPCDNVPMALPPLYPATLHHIQTPPGLTGRDLDRNALDLKGRIVEGSFLPHPMQRSNFDVTSLGSLRYQNLGNAMYPTQLYSQSFTDSINVTPMPNTHNYGSRSDHLMVDYFDDPLNSLHCPVGFSQEASLFSVRSSPQESMYQNPCGMMIPTPRFVASDGEHVLRGSGPIELAEIKEAPVTKQDLWPTSQEMFDVEIGDEAQSILDFMDQLLCPEKQPSDETPKKSQKKGKSCPSTKGVTKSRTRKKATSNVATSKKGNARGRKQQQAKDKSKLTKALSSSPSAPPRNAKVNTAPSNRIIAQRSEDGLSDATCLLLVPGFNDPFLSSLDRDLHPSDSMMSSDRDDVSDVYRILEDAGLEFLPNENTALPASCPLLPTSDRMSAPTWENTVEMAFTFLGKPVATVDELQSAIRSRLDLAARGPGDNPGLELWPGWDATKTFSDEDSGLAHIVTCLKKSTNIFRCTGKNERGQDLWECIPLVCANKKNTTAKPQGGKKFVTRQTKRAVTSTKRRKKTVLSSKARDGSAIKSLRVSHTNATVQSEK